MPTFLKPGSEGQRKLRRHELSRHNKKIYMEEIKSSMLPKNKLKRSQEDASPKNKVNKNHVKPVC